MPHPAGDPGENLRDGSVPPATVAGGDAAGAPALPVVLRRIVESARRAVGARYAALGVVADDGAVEHFLHAGIGSGTAERIGDPPRGRGMLGDLLRASRSIRVPAIDADPRATGFPPGHPPMGAFLGAAVRTSAAVYGNLYLTDPCGRAEFSAEDEELVEALAATAGLAIESARRSDEARRRQAWLAATIDVSRQLLGREEQDGGVLARIADLVRQLAAADVVVLAVPAEEEGDPMVVAAASGLAEDELLRSGRLSQAGLARQAMDRGRAFVVDASCPAAERELAAGVTVQEAMVLPLQGEGPARGAFLVGRTGGPRFGEADLVLAQSFACQATLALELADARADQHRVAWLEERDRIGRDLHDTVVQRLFAAGLGLERLAMLVPGTPASSRVHQLLEDLDETIRQVRSSVFALRGLASGARSTRRVVTDVVNELAPALGLDPRLQLDGPLDTLVDGAVLAELEAVLREVLPCLTRCTAPTRVDVHLTVDADRVELLVTGDGRAVDSDQDAALAGLRVRAEQNGGTLAIEIPPGGGLELRWSIPLEP